MSYSGCSQPKSLLALLSYLGCGTVGWHSDGDVHMKAKDFSVNWSTRKERDLHLALLERHIQLCGGMNACSQDNTTKTLGIHLDTWKEEDFLWIHSQIARPASVERVASSSLGIWHDCGGSCCRVSQFISFPEGSQRKNMLLTRDYLQQPLVIFSSFLQYLLLW